MLNNILRILQMLLAYKNEEAQRTEEVFSEDEIEFLKLVGSDLSMTHRFDPSKLSWATDIIVRLGGWKGNPKQRPLGPITLNRGLGKFGWIFRGWCIAKDVSIR